MDSVDPYCCLQMTQLTGPKAIVWSYYRNRLYVGGNSHDVLHSQNGIPTRDTGFDNVIRGRVDGNTVEVLSLGRHDWLPNEVFDALIHHFNLNPSALMWL
jgi:hypothetical protein